MPTTNADCWTETLNYDAFKIAKVKESKLVDGKCVKKKQCTSSFSQPATTQQQTIEF